jgi:hypothetical protein
MPSCNLACNSVSRQIGFCRGLADLSTDPPKELIEATRLPWLLTPVIDTRVCRQMPPISQK